MSNFYLSNYQQLYIDSTLGRLTADHGVGLLLKTEVIFLIITFALSGAASAQFCISPFTQLSSDHRAILDFDLFQSYGAEFNALKMAFPEKSRVSAELQKKNILALQAFYKNTSLKPAINTLDRSLQPQQAFDILNSIALHPVIGDQVAIKYDPTQEVGFCFGRAAYVHIELHRRGIAAQHIAKVFVMGGLFLDGIGWDFHVATIAQDSAGAWWTIDSLFKTPLPLEDWMSEVSKWDANQKFPALRFYFTQPSKFQALKGSYDSGYFYSEVYRRYFEDLTDWYAKGSPCQIPKPAADPHLFICQK